METDSKDHKLCRGCLSSDRRLTSVTTNHFYYSLLTEVQKREAQIAPCTALCWECIAMLRRIKKFQAQVQQTHTILQNCFGLYPAKPLLSSLSTSHKWDYDAIFEERNPNEQVDTIVTPTKYKTLDIEMKEKKEEKFEDIKCEEIITDVKTEYSSDDYVYDDHDNFNACSAIPNGSEITIKNRKTVQNAEKYTEQPIKRIPIVKTPALVKVEQELQCFIVSKIKNETTTSQKNHDKFKEDDQNNDSYTSADDVSKNEESKSKRKLIRLKSESDPDFSFEQDNSNSKRVTKRGLSNSEKRINKRYKYRKVFTRYKDIADVISYFTQVRMSGTDFRKVLEKEDAVVDNQKPYKCNVCGMCFEFLRFMRNHAVCHKKTYPEHFKNGQFLNLPLPIPENPCLWRCSICSRMVRREHAVTHVDVNHRIRYFCANEGCEWFPRFFWTREDHKEHIEAFHTQYLCDICGKKKKRKRAIETHMRQIHLKVLSVPCPQCELVFVSSYAQRKHALTKHCNDPPERRYCVECDVTYPSVIQLDMHFHQKHNKHSFPCGECGRVFRRKHAMKTHYNIIHKGKTNYQCNVCGKYLSKKRALERHLNSHNNIKLPYTKPCTVCGRMFQTNKTLQLHMYTHTGERPYRCPHCDAAYTQPYCLKVHLKKQHGVDTIVGIKDAGGCATSLDRV